MQSSQGLKEKVMLGQCGKYQRKSSSVTLKSSDPAFQRIPADCPGQYPGKPDSHLAGQSFFMGCCYVAFDICSVPSPAICGSVPSSFAKEPIA